MKIIFTNRLHILPLAVMLFMAFSGISQNLQISGGNNFSAAVCDNQQVFVWGANASGQLAIDATDAPISAAYSAVPIGVLRGNVDNNTGGLTYGNLPAIRQVDAGSGAHVLGLSCASQVWAWGENAKGQLGRNSTTSSAVPQRVLRGEQAAVIDPVNDPNGIFLNNIFYVSGGNNSSFALEKTTGRVLAWGQNASGELGNGGSVQQLTPVYVVKSAGDGGGQLTNITQIEGGDNCTYALDANGNVWSWGNNMGNKLGRLPDATAIVPTASRVIQGDPMNNGYSTTPSPTVYLSNIIQISGGDTHCLALDANGNVWSFGGDWGEGQLGRAGGSVYQNDARKVSIPGITTYATATNQFLGNGVDGKAVYVAAGQASSSVVMASGKVVTFGARGLYNAGSTPVASGTAIACPTPDGDMIMSGTLGDGDAGCNSGVCSGKGLAAQWSRTPEYVTVSGGGPLTNITQVSDGDAWYYAVSKTGTAYTWGWNRRGELGLGAADYTDRCFAVPFTLPSGCVFSNPCPGKPFLGANVVTCPIFSTTLNSNVPQTYSSYKYTWEFRPTTSGSWTTLGTAAGNNPTYTPADDLGQYRVTITDNRGTVPFLCAPCPTYMDTITFSLIPNPYTSTGCVDNSSNQAQFAITAPLTSKVKWFTNPSGGSALNPLDSNLSIIVPFSSTYTTYVGPPACAHGLWAEDVASYTGTLRPTATISGPGGCSVASAPAEGGSRSALMIEVSNDLTLTSVDFVYPSFNFNSNKNYTVKIYDNDPTGGGNGCTGCSGNKDGQGTLLYTAPVFNVVRTSGNPQELITIPISFPLTGTAASPVKYWILIDGDEVTYFNQGTCATPALVNSTPFWTTPEVDNSGKNVLRALTARHDNDYAGKSHIMNLDFETGTTYTCNRIFVCATGVCTLPVEFIYFNAEKKDGQTLLDWSTASEKNSAYYNVQRSSDGINFTSIGIVNASGNSNSIKSYSFIDGSAIPGVNYYKIIEYDIDGQTTTSEIKSVRNKSDHDVTIVPNPSNGNFTIYVEGEGNSSISLIVYNMLGQVVYQLSEKNKEASVYSKNMDLQNFPSGVYVLHVNSSGNTWVKKIIKE